MPTLFYHNRFSPVKKGIILFLVLSFVSSALAPPPHSYAQELLNLPRPGVMVFASPVTHPPLLRGITLHADDPLQFDFILDQGESPLQGEPLKSEATKLIKYFLASLTIPEDDLWVNLSPAEQDRIIPPDFGLTEMGRDLLAQDYLLKQFTASLIYPEERLGKMFWETVHAKVRERFGTSGIPVETFNKVWIVPGRAVVYEKDNTGFVVESYLKVMVEEDYLTTLEHLSRNESQPHDPVIQHESGSGSVASQIARTILIPEIEREINEGGHFAQLRQIYTSFILAAWYKQKVKEGLLQQLYVDQKKVAGVDVDDPQIKQKIYDQYLEAYRKGIYNYIKEDIDLQTQQVIPRKYVAGGVQLTLNPGKIPASSPLIRKKIKDWAQIPQKLQERLLRLTGRYGISRKPGARPPGADGDEQSVWQQLFARFGREPGPALPTVPKDTRGVSQPVWSAQVPDPRQIRRDLQASQYTDPAQGFSGVDLEHFVHAQHRLVNRRLSPRVLQDLLKSLDLDQNMTAHEAYPAIFRRLADGRYTRDIVDLINTLPDGRSTYSDPRLDVTVIGQHPNPRAQGIREAGSNSVDAIMDRLGLEDLKIGQFGMGVKQILDWLEASGEDRVDVVTRQTGALAGVWHQATILKDRHGQRYIQIKALVSEQAFQSLFGFPPMFAQGTIVRVKTQKAIPRTEQDLTQHQRNAQDSMAESIHTRFAYVPAVTITTQVGTDVHRRVNGSTTKRVIVGAARDTTDQQGDIHFVFMNHAVMILDNGAGMDAETLSRMFVPRAGTKEPEHLSADQRRQERERKVKLVHDVQLPHRVSFARNGEVITAVNIPEDLHPQATVAGGLMIEFGRLLDVPESRDHIRIPLDLKPGQVSDFELAVNHVIDGVIRHPDLSDEEKLKYINTLIVGLDQLVNGNANYAHIMSAIRTRTQMSLTGIIRRLEERDFVMLPHQKSFEKIAIPQGRRALYIHEHLFAWQGAVSLKKLGGHIVPGMTFAGEKRLPLVVVPFTAQSIRGVSRFHPDWHTWSEAARLPVIKTDRFVAIPQIVGERLNALAVQRISAGLDEEEQAEFARLAELVNIAVGEEVVTMYEIAAVREQMRVAPVEEVRRSSGRPDSRAVNRFTDFINDPPQGRTGHRSAGSRAPPADAGQTHVLVGAEVREVGTGTRVLGGIKRLTPLINGYYLIETDAGIGKLIRLRQGVAVREILVEGEGAVPQKIRLSPDRRFAYAEIGEEQDVFEIIDLERGTKMRLPFGFDPAIPEEQAFPLNEEADKSTFSNLHFSDDGRYVMATEQFRDGDSFLQFIVAIDLVSGKRVMRKWRSAYLLSVPSQDAEILDYLVQDYRIIGDLAVVYDPKTKMIEAYDLTLGARIAPSAGVLKFRAMHTDGSGTYTAFIDNAGKMHVYLHKTRKFLRDVGFDIGSTAAKYYRHKFKQQTLSAFVVMPAGGGDAVFFDDQGQLLKNWILPSDFDEMMAEIFTAQGFLEFHPFQGTALTSSADQRDPLERTDRKGIFKHPFFDVIIDNSDPGRPQVLDMRTGHMDPFPWFRPPMMPQRELVQAYPQRLLRDAQGGKLFIVDGATLRPANGIVFPEHHPQYHLKPQDVNDQYVLLSTQNETIGWILPVSWKDYPTVSFDGKYLVFVNDRTGDVLYLDPETPDNPIAVPVAKPLITDRVPADANQTIVLEKDGISSRILDAKNGQKANYGISRLRYVHNGFYLGSDHVSGGEFLFKRTPSQDPAQLLEIEIVLAAERIRLSPDKKFAFEVGKQGEMDRVYDLEQEKTYYLQNGFSADPLPDEQPGKALWNPQFSRDGSFLTYVEEGQPDHFVVIDLRKKQMLKTELPGDVRNHPFQYALSSYAGLAILRQEAGPSGASFLRFIDLKVGDLGIKGVHYHTDSSGFYTAMVDLGGTMHIYLHTTHRFVQWHQDDPLPVQEVVLKYLSGIDQPVLQVTAAGGQVVLIDPLTGDHLEQHPPAVPGAFQEAFSNKGYLSFTVIQGTSIKSVGLAAEQRDPLEQHDQRGIFKHPHFDLIIDNTRPAAPQAIDIRTGQTYPFPSPDAQVVHYDTRHQVVTFRILGEFVNVRKTGPGMPLEGWVDDAVLPQFLVFLVGGQYRIQPLGRPAGESVSLGITRDEYPDIYFDGTYAIFANPKTGAVRYVAPQTTLQPDPLTVTPDDVKARAQWQAVVVPQQDTWIAQVQTAYDPVFDLVNDETAGYREYRDAVEQGAAAEIEGLYQTQQQAIAERFQTALSQGQPWDATPSLPFDRFQIRMQRLWPYAKRYLAKVRHDPYLAHAEFAERMAYHTSLMTAVLRLAAQFDLDLEEISGLAQRYGMSETQFYDALFEVLAHGWQVTHQGHLDVVPVLGDLLAGLRDATNYRMKLRDVRTLIGFLSQAVIPDAQKNSRVVQAQIQKILRLNPQARNPYLTQLLAAFAHVDPGQLQAYLRDPDQPAALGSARSFVVFLTRDVKPVREATAEESALFVPQGQDIDLPDGGIELARIAELEDRRPKGGEADVVMDMDDLLAQRHRLPEASDKTRSDLLRDIRVQRESGAYTAEIAQNAMDAGAGELEIDFYLHTNPRTGAWEYVEEARDNGTGALDEVALLIRRSTKAAGQQRDYTGFFGTGKFTLFEGVDRVELITRNNKRAFLLTVAIVKDAQGQPVDIKLLGIREIYDETIPRGVTVRRIKSAENTVPELDQMLSQRAWKTFAGLSAQEDTFKIFLIDHEQKRQRLTVEREVFSQAAFQAVKPGETQAARLGTFRLAGAKDMPLQVVDRVGLRVGEIKPEYLQWVPQKLRKHIEDLGVQIQIPLPLIRGRSGFEHEQDYLPVIQKYVAVEVYKMMAYKTLTQTRPQFVFEGFPVDWETNDDYWDTIDWNDQAIISLANRINAGRYEEITAQELEALLPQADRVDLEKRFTKLILLLEVETPAVQGRISLLARRQAVQERINQARASRAARRLENLGFRMGTIPSAESIPDFRERVLQGTRIETAHDQMRDPQQYLIHPDEYTPSEHRLAAMAFSAARLVGVEQVLLLSSQVVFAGAFRNYKGKPTMFLNRSVARYLGQANERQGMMDQGSNGINHELSHWLEHLMETTRIAELWEQGFVAHTSHFTHDSAGSFGEAMKYMAFLWLMNGTPLEQNGSSAQSTSSPLRAAEPASANPGGISLNPALLDLQIQGDGSGRILPVSPGNLQGVVIDGLSPVIIHMVPIGSLPLLLGQEEREPPVPADPHQLSLTQP
jgi:hypothetical protein